MFQNRLKPAQGCLLVSEPFLMDPSFKRAVILLAKYDRRGAVGFVLNKPLNMTLKEATGGTTDFNASIYSGGPIHRDATFFIHTLGDRITNAWSIADGLYWGGEFESLKTLIAKKTVNPSDVRFFVGYAGWGTAQLEKEIKEKSWIIAPANREIILSSPSEKLWGTVLKNMGNEYAFLSNYPENPSMN